MDQKQVDEIKDAVQDVENPWMRSAIDAAVQAVMQPDVLVKVYIKERSDLLVMRMIWTLLERDGVLDRERCLQNCLSGKNIFELINGSGIEFVRERKSW